ncbi:hypothetical protein [Jiangella muralis]|uniref:hypothetical protein n=1 Tax=Jiangella muralis TaxID=702383 RepID=UPI00069E1A4E|nr:hypothetical protein [Jiangella muralis]
MRRWLAGLLITLVVAAGGGALAWWLATPDVVPERPVPERARAAADVLGDAHVYVDPSAAGTYADADLARLEAAAAASDPQVFVVVWPASREAGYGSPSDVLHSIGDLTGRPGLYIQVDPGVDLYTSDVGIEGEHYSIYSAVDDATQTEAAAVLQAIDENDGREYEVGEDTGSHYWGGTGGTIAAGLTIGAFSGFGAGLLGLGVWALARRRRAAA